MTRCRIRMFVADDDPGIVCTLPHEHLGRHVMAPERYVDVRIKIVPPPPPPNLPDPGRPF